jgi:localization factor PodJL
VDSAIPVSQRIKPDPKLPPVIRQIEMKALAGAPEAQHDLAAIYTAGHGGVEVDYAKAALWFQEAAVNGIANARYNLGVLYHQGLGVEKDVSKAINWYRAAAALGHPEAEYNLGIAYVEGIGIQYDPHKAAENFEQAARGGVMEAAYNLGLIHENGLLGDADMEEAIFWYKMASDYNPESRVAYNQLVKAMSLKSDDIESIVKKFNAVYGLNGKMVPKISAKRADAKPGVPATPAASNDGYVDPGVIPPLSKKDSQALMSAVNTDQTLLSQIQEQLIRLGLYPGPADGFSGPQTEDAIRSYQSKNNMSATGRPSEELLVHMLASELNAVAGSLESRVPPGLNN